MLNLNHKGPWNRNDNISGLAQINSKSITEHNSREFSEIYISTVDSLLNDIDCYLIIPLEVVGDSFTMLL